MVFEEELKAYDAPLRQKAIEEATLAHHKAVEDQKKTNEGIDTFSWAFFNLNCILIMTFIFLQENMRALAIAAGVKV